jgi:hypothetical protein
MVSLVSLAEDLKLALDRVAFARSIGFEPDEWQAEALRSTALRQLYNASRQSGKSTVAAVLVVHTALYDPMSLVLLVSPTLRQSQELFRKCLGFYAASSKPVPPESETALTLTLENASRIVSLPGGKGHTVRGYSSVRLLVVDEASRVPDELYASLRPMLAVSGGRLVALSAPFGTRGWWYEAWKSAEPWERYRVTAEECPRISSEFLEEERRTMGDWHYRQEYLGEFMDDAFAVFRGEDIEAMFNTEVPPLWASASAAGQGEG